MKNTIIIIIIAILILIGGVWWSKLLQNQDPNIISTTGIHWHPVLEIFIGDEKIVIPASIGLVGGEQPIHTHDEDSNLGVIHLEFSGLVIKDDVKLSEFFRVWDKDISSFGPNLKIVINGKENTEYGNYIMRDEDLIQLYYSN